MKFVGKVVGYEVVDTGKGKDAEAKEAGLLLVKLDAIEGMRRKVQLPMEVDELDEFDRGDVLEIEVRPGPQGKLPLKGKPESARAH